MANSKALSVKTKHQRKKAAAKAKMQEHLDGKRDAAGLPALAKLYLTRRMRVTKRG